MQVRDKICSHIQLTKYTVHDKNSVNLCVCLNLKKKKDQHLGKSIKINFAMLLIEYFVCLFLGFSKIAGLSFFISAVIQMQRQFFRATNGLVGHYSSCTVRP